jgi:TonB family protein
MSSRHWFAVAIGAVFSCMVTSVRADLPSAEAAYDKKEFERAFALYRELAELGHRNAQENLAVMYVSGEGVKRDNVLGYAWARIALEQGKSEGASGIIAQLEPHMKNDSRRRADEVMARFGQAALRARLLPVEVDRPPEGNTCQMTQPANPDNFYPRGGVSNEIGGDVIVDFTVQPDGRAHSARIVNASTPYLFDEAARGVVMHSVFKPKMKGGAGVTCNMRIKVKFKMRRAGTSLADKLEDKLPGTKARAEAGDPEAQYVYALVLLNIQELNPAGESPFPWLLKAAQAGVANAQYIVGVFTLAGLRVERDPDKAVIWLEKSAAAGNPQAQRVLANYLVTSRMDPESRAKAAQLLEAAVKQNYYSAKYSLAALLATSPEASMRDPQRALQLIGEVMPVYDYDPVAQEVRAAANAWIGDFDDAVRSQKIALFRARKLGWDVAPLEARLADYQAKKTWTGNLIAW